MYIMNDAIISAKWNDDSSTFLTKTDRLIHFKLIFPLVRYILKAFVFLVCRDLFRLLYRETFSQ